jgi:hypothetical protein
MRANVSACCDGRTKKNRRVQTEIDQAILRPTKFHRAPFKLPQEHARRNALAKAFAAFANFAAIRLEVTPLSPHDPSFDGQFALSR